MKKFIGCVLIIIGIGIFVSLLLPNDFIRIVGMMVCVGGGYYLFQSAC